MRTNQTIRAIFSTLLLLVFLTGITPRQYWHDLLADHRDVVSAAKHSDELQVNKTGINCGWNSQVAATSPFIETEAISLPAPSTVFISYTLAPFAPLHFTAPTHQLLRGPPAIA